MEPKLYFCGRRNCFILECGEMTEEFNKEGLKDNAYNAVAAFKMWQSVSRQKIKKDKYLANF